MAVSSINLLEAADPEGLQRLRARYPENIKLLDADLCGVADQSTQVSAELAVTTLDAVAIEADRLLGVLSVRLNKAERWEAAAAVGAAIGSGWVGIGHALSAQPLPFTTTASLLAVVGAIVIVGAKLQRKGVFRTDLTPSVAALLSMSEKAKLAARRLRRYLDTADSRDYTPEARRIIDQSEEMAADLLATFRLVGTTPRSALAPA
jgi:hypothetical protein